MNLEKERLEFERMKVLEKERRLLDEEKRLRYLGLEPYSYHAPIQAGASAIGSREETASQGSGEAVNRWLGQT